MTQLNIRTDFINILKLKKRLQLPTNKSTLSDSERSQIIENILLGLPIQALYVHEDFNGHITAINYKIISTMMDFIDSDFKITNSIFIEEAEGKYYHQLPPRLSNKIDDIYVDIFSIQNDNSLELKKRIEEFVKKNY